MNPQLYNLSQHQASINEDIKDQLAAKMGMLDEATNETPTLAELATTTKTKGAKARRERVLSKNPRLYVIDAIRDVEGIVAYYPNIAGLYEVFDVEPDVCELLRSKDPDIVASITEMGALLKTYTMEIAELRKEAMKFPTVGSVMRNTKAINAMDVISNAVDRLFEVQGIMLPLEHRLTVLLMEADQ